MVFNQPVTLASDAIAITPKTGVTVNGGVIAPSTDSVTASLAAVSGSNGMQYLVTFSGDGTHGSGLLDGGVWDLTIDNAKVSDGTTTMADDVTGAFFSMFATVDANNNYALPGGTTSNAFVDPGSLFQFTDAFGSYFNNPYYPTPVYNPTFDVNLDGYVDVWDLFNFSDWYGTDWSWTAASASAPTLVAFTAKTYDAAGRVTEHVSAERNGVELDYHGYEYDFANRVTRDQHNGDIKTYAYDNASQLTSETNGSGTTTYAYDANGNREEVDSSNNDDDRDYTTGDDNQYETDGVWDYTYSPNGNLTGRVSTTTDETWEYTYDHRNQLIRVDRMMNGVDVDQRVEFTYDAWGNRVGKTVVADVSIRIPSSVPLMESTQYASSVIAMSSEYTNTDWSAAQTLGAPDVAAFADDPNAWAALEADNAEFLTLGIAQPMYVQSVTIRESYNGGFVTKVELVKMDDSLVTIWSGVDPSSVSSIANFTVYVRDLDDDPTETSYLVKGVKITIDGTHVLGNWEEIDSVSLHGRLPTQYVSSVIDKSSEWDPGDYSAAQVTGPSDVFAWGDSPNAWAALEPDNEEFLTLGLAVPMYVQSVTVRENCNVGFVTKVELIKMDDSLVTIWSGVDPSTGLSVADFTVLVLDAFDDPTETAYLVKGVKITIDGTHTLNDYEEIDSVAVHGSFPPMAADPVTTHFTIDGWNPSKGPAIGLENFDVWAEDDGSSLTTRYLWGDGVKQLLGRTEIDGETETALWYLTDKLGSINTVISATGEVLDKIDYDAFGNIISESHPENRGRFAWTAQEREDLIDGQLNGERFYFFFIGGWSSKDPGGFVMGDPNLYRYVGNSPTNWRDPSGYDIILGPFPASDRTPLDLQYDNQQREVEANHMPAAEIRRILSLPYGEDPVGSGIRATRRDYRIARYELYGLIAGFIPGLGDEIDAIEFGTGVDLATGEPLTRTERAMTGIGMLIPLVGGRYLRQSAQRLFGQIDEFCPRRGVHLGRPPAGVVAPAVRIVGANDAEHAIDQILRMEGRRVEANILEGIQGAGRQSDRLIDGILTEYKTISEVAQHTADALSGAIANRVMNGRGQAGHIIVNVSQQAGMTQEIAERGIRRAYGADNATGGTIQLIRIIGNGFDITVPRAR